MTSKEKPASDIEDASGQEVHEDDDTEDAELPEEFYTWKNEGGAHLPHD